MFNQTKFMSFSESVKTLTNEENSLKPSFGFRKKTKKLLSAGICYAWLFSKKRQIINKYMYLKYTKLNSEKHSDATKNKWKIRLILLWILRLLRSVKELFFSFFKIFVYRRSPFVAIISKLLPLISADIQAF